MIQWPHKRFDLVEMSAKSPGCHTNKVLVSCMDVVVYERDAPFRFLLYRAFMERLRRVFHTDDRKVLVSIDRLDLCKVIWDQVVHSRG